MSRDRSLGSLEEIVLLSLARLDHLEDDDAYGMTVRRELQDRTGVDYSVGAVYSTLDRLESKGLVTSRLADPEPERGGRPRRYFTVTEAALAALTEARTTRERLWSDLDGRVPDP